MACCVLVAAIVGLVASFKALLMSTRAGKQTAQEWRLVEREDGHG